MEARVAQAVAAFERGDLAKARDLAERQLGEAPSPQLHHLMGLIHCRQGQPAAGAEWLRRAADAEPQNLPYRVMLVRALIDSGRAAEALDAAERPAGQSPVDLAMWLARAEAAEGAQDFAEAGEAWHALCSARPSDWRGWVCLGRNLLALTQVAEAEKAYGQALELAPGQAGNIYRLQSRDADAAGNAAKAFEAAARMNRATEGFEEWRKQASAYRAELRELARMITPEWAARLPKPDPAAASPGAFLVGFPRSGTTLLDTFLMGHPQIAVIEEQGLLVAAARPVGPLGALPQCSPSVLGQARDIYWTLIQRHVGVGFGGMVIDKAPLNMLLAPLIHVLFGNVPIIFAQRHPCDAVLSAFMQNFTPNLGMASFLEIEDAADFYDAAMRVWTASTEALPLRTHKVVYEELVRDPESALRPVIEFLGLEWDGRMLDHQATAKTRGPINNPSADQIMRPLSEDSVGRWTRYQKQLEPVLPVLLPWAERLGYRT